MKTITIPKSFGYPTVDIVLNGMRHTLQSGVEITVDDALAEVIENAIALAPKYSRSISRLAQRVEGSIGEITSDDLRGVNKIGSYAFAYCAELKSIEIPNSITSIENHVFWMCSGLKSVVIPNSVENIASHAFYGCSRLEELLIGDSVKSIGTNVFDWCAGLKNVYLPETPPTLSNVNAFDNINSACVFYCKTQESLNKYKAAENWSTLSKTYTFAVES